MAVAAYTLRLSPPPRHGSPLLPRLRPHLRRRAAAKVAASWAPAGGDSDDGFGGWGLPEPPPFERERRTGIGRAIAVGLAASAAISLAGLAWHSPSSRKCLQQLINSSLHYVQEKMSASESQETTKEDASEIESDETEASSTVLDEKAEAITDESRQNHAGGTHVLFSVPVDPIHEEAFSILKKLQIIVTGFGFEGLEPRFRFADPDSESGSNGFADPDSCGSRPLFLQVISGDAILGGMIRDPNGAQVGDEEQVYLMEELNFYRISRHE